MPAGHRFAAYRVCFRSTQPEVRRHRHERALWRCWRGPFARHPDVEKAVQGRTGLHSGSRRRRQSAGLDRIEERVALGPSIASRAALRCRRARIARCGSAGRCGCGWGRSADSSRLCSGRWGDGCSGRWWTCRCGHQRRRADDRRRRFKVVQRRVKARAEVVQPVTVALRRLLIRLRGILTALLLSHRPLLSGTRRDAGPLVYQGRCAGVHPVRSGRKACEIGGRQASYLCRNA